MLQYAAMSLEQDIAALLLDIGAVKIQTNPLFTWVSGIRSPVYCDNRMLISHPQPRAKIVQGFVDRIKESGVDPEYIGGTATAAIPWAAFVSYEMNLPMIYIRPEKKDHGAGRQVEGQLPAGKRVLIIEDLISTGGSSVKAAAAVTSESNGVVSDIMAIITYEMEESKKNLRDAGLRLTTLTTFSHILALALERKIISQDDWNKLLEFRKDPRTWAASYGY